MHKTIITVKENKTGAAAAVTGVVYQPKTNFNGAGIKWYQDKRKDNKHEMV